MKTTSATTVLQSARENVRRASEHCLHSSKQFVSCYYRVCRCCRQEAGGETAAGLDLCLYVFILVVFSGFFYYHKNKSEFEGPH